MTITATLTTFDDPQLVTRLEAAKLPTSDLSTADQFFFVFTDASRAIGCGGFLLAGEHALMRSIVVDDDRRGTGAGAAILERLIVAAEIRGARHIWLLTTNADGFFARHGFNQVARAEAPPAIAATPQFSGVCPGSAAFMHRSLAERSAAHVGL